jgi:hypothetical protein
LEMTIGLQIKVSLISENLHCPKKVMAKVSIC